MAHKYDELNRIKIELNRGVHARHGRVRREAVDRAGLPLHHHVRLVVHLPDVVLGVGGDVEVQVGVGVDAGHRLGPVLAGVEVAALGVDLRDRDVGGVDEGEQDRLEQEQLLSNLIGLNQI